MARVRRGARGATLGGAVLGTLLGTLVGTLWSVGSPSPAQAYVRYESKTGNPYAWREGCVWMLIYPRGMTDMAPEAVFAAEHAAQATWSSAQQTCSYMDIIDTDVPVDVPPPAPSYDLTNTTVFHSDRWCRTGADSNGADCYPSEALAITSVWTTSDGHIYDADIEVNAVNFRWADLVTSQKDGFQDLQNTLTHETGHLLGLDHTCFIPDGKSVAPKDNNGNTVPDCSGLALNDPIRGTTMFPSAEPGDTDKRKLAPDDIQAVCDIYPAANGAAHACIPPATTEGPKSSSGGCAVSGGSEPASSWTVLGLVLGLCGAWRRRRLAQGMATSP